MKAYLYVDVETSGLSPSINDIVQLACVPVIDGRSHESFNEFCQPANWNTIDAKSIEVHGITIEMMRGFQSPHAMLDKFVAYLAKFNTKFVIAGYNSNFDKAFLGAIFAKNARSN